MYFIISIFKLRTVAFNIAFMEALSITIRAMICIETCKCLGLNSSCINGLYGKTPTITILILFLS